MSIIFFETNKQSIYPEDRTNDVIDDDGDGLGENEVDAVEIIAPAGCYYDLPSGERFPNDLFTVIIDGQPVRVAPTGIEIIS